MRTRALPRGVVATAAASVLLSGTLNGSVAHAGATPRCFGEPATIVGGPGEERVEGTAGRDVIFSRWDRQTLSGLGGDDLLCGLGIIHGGMGNDRMSTRNEWSDLYGGPGNDEMHRHEPVGDDPHVWNRMVGGPGSDRLYGGQNLDRLVGGPGRDRMFGSDMQDILVGGPGGDLLVGGWARDKLRGKSGDDRLRGKGRADRLVGGPGNDQARGGPGGDTIKGEGGSDVAYGGADFDWCVAEKEVRCEGW